MAQATTSQAQQLRDAAPLPDFLISLRRRLADLVSLPEDSFAQALITEYRPGTPLGWHRDAPNYELVAGVSLGGRCRIRFRPYPPRRGRDPKTFALELEPRSVYVMRDEVRWNWQHSIPATPEQRWSITFRTLRHSRQLMASACILAAQNPSAFAWRAVSRDTKKGRRSEMFEVGLCSYAGV